MTRSRHQTIDNGHLPSLRRFRIVLIVALLAALAVALLGRDTDEPSQEALGAMSCPAQGCSV
jgi:hypothetical protein